MMNMEILGAKGLIWIGKPMIREAQWFPSCFLPLKLSDLYPGCLPTRFQGAAPQGWQPHEWMHPRADAVGTWYPSGSHLKTLPLVVWKPSILVVQHIGHAHCALFIPCALRKACRADWWNLWQWHGERWTASFIVAPHVVFSIVGFCRYTRCIVADDS